MFSAVNLSEKYLDSLVARQTALNNNIANIDTPGYKRQDVRFNQSLEKAIKKNKVADVEIETYTDMETMSYRMDGNNVDVDKEMGELAIVETQYMIIAQRASAQLNKYKTLLQNIK